MHSSFQFILSLLIAFTPLVACSSASGDLFVSAATANSVMRFDETTGAFLGNFVAAGSGGLGDPQGIAFGPDGNLYVASNGSNNVLRYDGQTGAFIDVFASATGITWPAEINFRDGFLYVSDFSASGAVYRFDGVTGALESQFASGAVFADGQAWDASGNLYVSSGSNVRRYDGTTGTFIDNFVAGGIGLALDNLFLPDGTLLVSDFNNNVIRQYAADGTFLGNAITGLPGPQGLEIGPDGHLYAGSFASGIINRYDINTFALLGNAATASSLTNNFTFGPPAQVPEPASLGLLGAVACLGIARRRRGAVGGRQVR